MNTNANAKRVLCYGDSNTWGAVPLTDERYSADIRWTGVLQNLLDNQYEIIEEGLCGRTFSVLEEEEPHRRGITHIESILRTHEPLDFVIVMLGTNDMKNTFNLSVEEIGNHLQETIALIKNQNINNILIICPPAVTKPYATELDFSMERALELSVDLPKEFEKISKQNNCLYLNAGENITLEKTDGYHLNSEHHSILANMIFEKIK